MTRALRYLVLAPALAAAIAVAAVAYSATGGDAAFERRQENARPTRAADLERVMRTTQEPYGRRHARNVLRATCTPGGSGELQNPWSCRLEYGSGRRGTFRVNIRSDGAFQADHREGNGSVVGCCVEAAG